MLDLFFVRKIEYKGDPLTKMQFFEFLCVDANRDHRELLEKMEDVFYMEIEDKDINCVCALQQFNSLPKTLLNLLLDSH